MRATKTVRKTARPGMRLSLDDGVGQAKRWKLGTTLESG